MNLTFEVTGTSANQIYDKAKSIADAFYGYRAKIEKITKHKDKSVTKEFIDNPEPRPYTLIYGTASVDYGEGTYGTVFKTTVTTTSYALNRAKAFKEGYEATDF